MSWESSRRAKRRCWLLGEPLSLLCLARRKAQMATRAAESGGAALVQDFGTRRCFSKISLIPLKNHFKKRRSKPNFPLQADPPHPFSFVRLIRTCEKSGTPQCYARSNLSIKDLPHIAMNV